MSSSLHNHTMFSPLDGFSEPEEYLKRAKEIGLKAFAVTEHGNQYSWVYFDEIKNKYPEVKMIYGIELYECKDMNIKDDNDRYYHLVALAKNEDGRRALNEIISISNFEGFYYKPRISINKLKPYANNLIVSSACLASKLSKENNYNKCIEYVNEYKTIFPYFYLEMQSHKSEQQEIYNQKILQLSKDTNTPFIITTDSHAVFKEDLEYQKYHVQIARDNDTIGETYEGCYLQTDEEIHIVMDSQIGKENVDLGLQNTDKIADMIDVVDMPFQKPVLPTYPLPKEFESNYDYIQHLCKQGWLKRKMDIKHKHDLDTCKKRLEYELSVIHQMGFDGYFLIVWDFINWARNNNIMVGDGRGSAAGSLVCYLMGITNIDPIKYDLIFQRFLNPERVSMPDIDVDVNDRDKVIQYITNKYGVEKVCQVINFSYITPVVAIKDVGRILGIPYNIVDAISKRFSYPTFKECLENNSTIIHEFPQYNDLFKIAEKLSGKLRQVSIHAGGVGIVDTKITDYMGMKLGSRGEHVIQVDKILIEQIGIIKFDILGVQTLDIIYNTVKSAGIDFGDIDINNIKFENDIKSFELLCSANTNGVFQVESAGMKDLLLRLQPHNLEELSALIALYRPDSMGFIEPYINSKKGIQPIEYIHNDMKSILHKTYGCMIYQEQLMDIVRVFGGRTYGGSDKFRKAIGKKMPELVKEESEKLYHEIIQNNYSEEIAKILSDEMSTKGGYLFNKSHSTGYAVMCLQTAYLKANYPIYFMNALLNQNKDNYGMLNKYILDAEKMNIKILPPNINHSDSNFKVYNNSILFGLQAIKGVGETFVNKIINERNKGIFKNFNDFKQRIEPSESQIVSLVKAGAIPNKDKKQFLINYAKSLFKNSEYKNVVSLPTQKILKEQWGIDTDIIKNKEERLKIYNEKREQLYKEVLITKYKNHMDNFCKKHLQDEEMWEFDMLSIFLTNNPFKEIYQYIKPFNEIEDCNNGVIVGVISNIVKKKDRHKKQFAYITIYSAFGAIEVICWASKYSQYQEMIKKGNKMAVLCKKEDEKAFVEAMKSFEQWKQDVKIFD